MKFRLILGGILAFILLGSGVYIRLLRGDIKLNKAEIEALNLELSSKKGEIKELNLALESLSKEFAKTMDELGLLDKEKNALAKSINAQKRSIKQDEKASLSPSLKSSYEFISDRLRGQNSKKRDTKPSFTPTRDRYEPLYGNAG